MRRFYSCENDEIITLDDVRAVYEDFEKENYERDGLTFADYLRNVTDKNGDLTELPEKCVFRFETLPVLTYSARFVEIHSGLKAWFDASHAHTFAEAVDEMERQAREEFGDNTEIEWRFA